MGRITNKAKLYAGKVVNNTIMNILSRAYQDGFDDGMGKSKSKDNIVFVDLGLPSGTFWASTFLRIEDKVQRFAYTEAQKFSIPTDEQWKELQELCLWNYFWADNIQSSKIECVGPNGNSIFFDFVGDERYTLNFYFWLKGPVHIIEASGVKYKRIRVATIRRSGDNSGMTVTQYEKVDFAFPLRLVIKGR